MSQVIPNPKAPSESTDYIYGKRMEKYEDRMNFFLNEKVDIDKTNIKDIDAGDVSGLEGIIQRFTTWGGTSLPSVDENGMIAGTEASGKAKSILDYLIQLAKDAVDFIMNFINNRLARLDNRSYRVGLERKREGVKPGDCRYPASIRRLVVPQKTGLDPNWVTTVLGDVKSFYTDSIKTYRYLNGLINSNQAGGHLKGAVDDAIKGLASNMSMTKDGDSYKTAIIPGNRQLVIDIPLPDDPTKIDMYFVVPPIEVKVPATYESSSNLLDSTLKDINDIIKTIRSNQSTISQMSRDFEKRVRLFENDKNSTITPEDREFFNWLIRLNKRLMNTVIQYTVGALDAGMDFVMSGVDKK